MKPESGGYNSDTHLVYRSDTSTLEIWWRTLHTLNGEFTKTELCRRTSTNGTVWTEAEVMFDSSVYGYDYVSPSIIFEDNKYKMWGIYGKNIRYNESADGKTWSFDNERTLAVTWNYNAPWHLDVVHTDKGYEFLVQCYNVIGGTNNEADLFYLVSEDNITFPRPQLILQKSTDPNGMDNRGIYRASFVVISGIYHVYYSYVANDTSRGIALSTGVDILKLKGYQGNGRLDKSKVRVDDVNGLKLPRTVITPSSKVESGAYLKASSNIPRTAQITGEINKNMSAGLQIGRLYMDESEDVAGQSLDAIAGAIRRAGEGFELYTGSAWYKINDPRTFLEVVGEQTITDLDLGLYNLIVLRGTGVISINSVKNGDFFAETRIVIDSSTISCSINDANGIVTPGRAGVTLDQTNVSCIISRMASTRWRVY